MRLILLFLEIKLTVHSSWQWYSLFHSYFFKSHYFKTFQLTLGFRKLKGNLQSHGKLPVLLGQPFYRKIQLEIGSTILLSGSLFSFVSQTKGFSDTIIIYLF